MWLQVTIAGLCSRTASVLARLVVETAGIDRDFRLWSRPRAFLPVDRELNDFRSDIRLLLEDSLPTRIWLGWSPRTSLLVRLVSKILPPFEGCEIAVSEAASLV
jgi:hypothetical protein